MQKCGIQNKKNLHSPRKFQESYDSNGIQCDVNILVSAMKMPHQNEKATINPKMRGSSKLAEAMNICMTEVLNGFTKEELKNYMIQLLSNSYSLNGLNDEQLSINEDRNHLCQSAVPNMSTKTRRYLADQSPAFSNSNTNCPSHFTNSNSEFCHGRFQKRGKPTSRCSSEISGSSNEDRSETFLAGSDLPNKEDSNFNRIMRLLDILCEMRPLMNCKANSTGKAVKKGEKNEATLHVQQSGKCCRETSLPNAESGRQHLYTSHNLQWPTEELLRGCTDRMEAMDPHRLTPLYARPNEDILEPPSPQDTHYSQAVPPSPLSFFARSNMDTVVTRRPHTSECGNRPGTRSPCTPRSSILRPKSPPVGRPTNPTQSFNDAPCPLVAPRMALNNPYLRLNES